MNFFKKTISLSSLFFASTAIANNNPAIICLIEQKKPVAETVSATNRQKVDRRIYNDNDLLNSSSFIDYLPKRYAKRNDRKHLIFVLKSQFSHIFNRVLKHESIGAVYEFLNYWTNVQTRLFIVPETKLIHIDDMQGRFLLEMNERGDLVYRDVENLPLKNGLYSAQEFLESASDGAYYEFSFANEEGQKFVVLDMLGGIGDRNLDQNIMTRLNSKQQLVHEAIDNGNFWGVNPDEKSDWIARQVTNLRDLKFSRTQAESLLTKFKKSSILLPENVIAEMETFCLNNPLLKRFSYDIKKYFSSLRLRRDWAIEAVERYIQQH